MFILCRQSSLDERHKVQRTEFIPCFRGVYATVHSVLEHFLPILRRNYLAAEDLIPAEGVIIDKQPNAFFKVRLNNSEHVVLAAISGKMRKNRIRILVGDRVSVEMSPYDLTRGRITYRFK